MTRTFLSQRPRRASLVRALLGASLVAGMANAAAQAPGTLDPGFGIGGRVLTNSGAANDRLHALLALDDGSVVAVGQTTRTHPAGGSTVDVMLARYRADGVPDGSFGSGGFTGIDSSRTADIGYALARLSDGSLLVAGKFGDGGPAYSDFGVAKLSADGQLDAGFGAGGIAHVNLAPTSTWNDNASAVAVQSTGKIVLGGVAYATEGATTYPRFGLVRFHANGTLDTGFGNNGSLIVPSPMAAGVDYLTAIARLPDGRLPADDAIIAVGHTAAGNTAIVLRYSADGQPDPGFGSGGRVLLSAAVNGGVHTGLSTITAAVMQPDGRLILVGQGTDRGFAFIRLLASGAPDPGFGTNGRAHVKFTGATLYDEPFSVTLQGNGKIVAGGYAALNENDFAVARLLADGTPDPGFGDGQGRAVTSLSTRTDRAAGVAVAPGGAIVLAGYAQIGSAGQAEDFALARFFGDSDLIFRNGFELP